MPGFSSTLPGRYPALCEADNIATEYPVPLNSCLIVLEMGHGRYIVGQCMSQQEDD